MSEFGLAMFVAQVHQESRWRADAQSPAGAEGIVQFMPATGAHVEHFNAGRSAANFHENRQYPRLILQRWEPLYVAAGWGNGACTARCSL
ncbi:transglycosylase SLT domain-containing protein [Salinicola lusitanus]|uniref:transglycosylase SLT domain-containing protein n=1 Tax=Salinicola lusitanus TaxID=1949085 RepID=UPI000DA20D9A|nr:transglycosylase SLT domain-containing protein [Salinicola lusitanus]